MALTDKQKLFAKARLAGANNKDAAIAAGYSPATAAQQGCKMARHPGVVELISLTGQMLGKPVAPKVKAPTAPVEMTKAVQSILDEKPVKATKATGALPEFSTSPVTLIEIPETEDPKVFLLAVMNKEDLDVKIRVDAAKTVMPFVHTKKGEGGKKDQANETAKKIAGGFVANQPPKLKAVGS